MVKNSGEASGTGSIRPLNPPIPLDVKEDEHYNPVSIILGQRHLWVTNTEDQWQIDEEWWRVNPTSRIYYRVILENGLLLTIFRDTLKNKWYRQHY